MATPGTTTTSSNRRAGRIGTPTGEFAPPWGTPGEWADRAACAGEDTQPFFPADAARRRQMELE